MTANPPKISLLFTGDEFCSTIIVIASPPPMAFFGIRNRRLSPSAYRQNSPPTAKNTTATFRFPDSGMVCLPQPSACAYACGFPSCFMIWLSLFPCSFPESKNLLKIPHDLLFFFHGTVQLFFYFPYIGFSVHITHPLS